MVMSFTLKLYRPLSTILYQNWDQYGIPVIFVRICRLRHITRIRHFLKV